MYVKDDRIVGLIRVTPSCDNRLPVSEVFDDLVFTSDSYQLSRMIVEDKSRLTEARLSLVATSLFVGCAEYLKTRRPGVIVIDAIVKTDCVIKPETYKRMGFASQDREYRDRRYGADSVVLIAAHRAAVEQFLGWASRMKRRWATRISADV